MLLAQIAAAAAFTEGVVERDRRGDRDIEALNEAVHRDDDCLVRFFNHLGRDTVFLVTEYDRRGTREIHFLYWLRTCIEMGREDLVSAAFKFARAIARRFPTFDVEPLIRTLRNAVRALEPLTQLDNVRALKPHRLRTSEDGADVSAIVNVFEYRYDVASSQINGGLDPCLTFRS